MITDSTIAETARSRLLCIVGARPNFMKIAPLMRAFTARRDLAVSLVHTGQHYDAAMKAAFFGELGIPEPDEDLGVGSGSHAVQTAEVMRRFEPILERYAPDAVLVVGDVNSTLACALVAAKRLVPVVHVEAGLRSFDRRMPEEINRVLTDQLAALLYITERPALDNLLREGIPSERVVFVGNVMIDTLQQHRSRAPAVAEIVARLRSPDTVGATQKVVAAYGSADEAPFGLVTLHRPSNVDDAAILRGLIGTLAEVGERLPLIFPLHPRTRDRLNQAGLLDEAQQRFLLLPPVGYLDMLGLMSAACVVLTDSGGVQEETTALGVPCITLRETTERPVTVVAGTNTVVGTAREKILGCVADVLASGGKRGRIPEGWDGHAAERIAEHLAGWLLAQRTGADAVQAGADPAGTGHPGVPGARADGGLAT